MSEEDESMNKKTCDFYVLNWKTGSVKERSELKAKSATKISRGKLAGMVFDKFCDVFGRIE